ncbi:MAG: PAS domain S-box protein [Gammaproteobacteria bacterium]|nr:PAS domain S-box protein [Gammaproteobacteria bacterium]
MTQTVLPETGTGQTRDPQPADLAFRALLTSSVVAAICVSPNSNVLSANPFLLRLLRLESLQKLRELDFKTEVLANAADWQHWERARATSRIAEQELSLRAADGREILLNGDIWSVSTEDGKGDFLLGVFTDVTKNRQIDATLQAAAQSEATVSLMGGIVHDFNNLLTVLVGNLYLVAEGVRDKPTLFDQTKRARDVAQRGADLIRQLLAFSREDRVSTKTLDTKNLLSNLKPLLEHALGSRVSVDLALDPDTAYVDATAAQLESVIVNLAMNARDAIETEGSIVIAIRIVRVEDGGAQERGPPVGRYVSISVTDDGCGIPELLQDRVFEPYFSTKGEQRGTGLGLSMVRQFAEQCGGDVQLSSRPGIGTTVTVRLPASRGTPEDSSIMTMPLKTLPTGEERILLLAGDPEISRTIEESLSILGYATRISSNLEEFSDLLSDEEYSLVIIDSSAGTATELDPWLAQIRSHHTSVAILLIAAGARKIPHGQTNIVLLKKPFPLKDLAIAVRRLLDRDSDV